MLPGERVEYINTFKKEKGKWKLLLIVSETGSELGAGATPPKSLGEGRS